MLISLLVYAINFITYNAVVAKPGDVCKGYMRIYILYIFFFFKKLKYHPIKFLPLIIYHRVLPFCMPLSTDLETESTL